METLGLRDYLAILRRRKLHIAVPAVLIFALAVLVAFVLPPVYRSTATVLIEEADIPKEMVRSTVTSYAEQRLQQIQQKMTAMSSLVDLITKYNLYEKPRRSKPMTEVAEKMRADITMSLVNAPVIDRMTGRPSQEAIAFTLSFDHGNPLIAQQVANELLSRFLEEDLKVRREQTKETTQFLSGELQRLEEAIAEIEQQMAQFKGAHAGGMPEELPFNMQMAERANRDMQEIARQMQVVEERRGTLRGNLAMIDPFGAVIVDGKQVAAPKAQLKALQAQYVSLTGRYGAEHPDVGKARREIEALERELGLTSDSGVEVQLADARARLATAESNHSAGHPDVARLQSQVRQLEGELSRKAGQPPSVRRPVETPDNPAYLQVQAQLEGLDTEQKSLAVQREEARRQRDAYEVRIRQTAQVEREWSSLKRDYENAVLRYKDLKDKEMAAQMAEAMERGHKSERLSVIEPPLQPEKPVKPPRLLIVALGLVVALGGGVGTAAMAEAISHVVHGSRHMEDLTGLRPLITIPYIRTQQELVEFRRLRKRILMGSGVAAILILVLIDKLLLPLDVIALSLAQRLGML